MENKTDTKEGGRVYELAYLLLPTIAEESVATEVTTIKDMIEKRGGQTVSDEYPKLIELAYSMEKVIANKKEHFNSAYFGWIKFDLEQNAVNDLKNELMLYPHQLRFLIVKTVRENTMASRRPVSRDYKRKPVKKEEGGEEINKEELDKQIDAMAVTE